MSARHQLSNVTSTLATTVFLGDVIAANPSKVAEWFDALADLPPEDMRVLQLAAWYSGAAEATQYLATRGVAPELETAPQSVLDWDIDGGEILDALWLHYFATGDLAAVRRIISVLEFLSELGAAEQYLATQQTDEDRARALRDALFQAAQWSLASLMQEHPPLQAYCGQLVSSDALSAAQRVALAIVLEKVNPSEWRVQVGPGTDNVTVTRLAPPRSASGASKRPWWKLW